MAIDQRELDPGWGQRGSIRSAADAALLAELVARARTGDRQAVTRIVVLCTPMVRAVGRRYLTNRADVDDVVQDVWVALAEHLHRIESPTSLRAWLVRVTAHAAWRVGRREGRTRPLDTVGDRASADDTETQVVDRMHRAVVSWQVRSALDRLRPADRRLLTLLAADDRPDYRAVSRALGCPVGSIGPTRQRALKRLRRQQPLVRLVSPPTS